jgi:hypothetical protein
MSGQGSLCLSILSSQVDLVCGITNIRGILEERNQKKGDFSHIIFHIDLHKRCQGLSLLHLCKLKTSTKERAWNHDRYNEMEQMECNGI